MKVLFKSKTRTPVDIVRQTRDLLVYFDSHGSNLDLGSPKREEKMALLCKLLRELKFMLYGSSESEPIPESCAQLTREFFRGNTFRLLIVCLPKLNLEARKDATQVVANLQRQQVYCRLIACDYLEANMDLMDMLVTGYEDCSLALHYGGMLRECIRHQSVAKYVLENHLRKFFKYIQLPYFEVSSDASATFKELLTRHKSTVAEFLSKNYDWFFEEYTSKLLRSPEYVTRRLSVKLLGDILLDRSNAGTMLRYVSSLENLRIFMDLLRDSHAIEKTELESCDLEQKPSKVIQRDAFHVFKLFVANQHKPPEVVAILIANRSKLLRFFSDFSLDKEDVKFEADKAQVIREIASLEFNPQMIRSIKDSETL